MMMAFIKTTGTFNHINNNNNGINIVVDENPYRLTLNAIPNYTCGRAISVRRYNVLCTT